jgi:carbon monoxide dehydrogenase subunit G
MTVNVDIDLGYEFTVKASSKDVFDLLSDVPKSVAHFPKVHALVDIGDGAYRWEMEKVGTAQVNIQTIYASKYVSDRKKGTVVWTPVKGVGNALVGGSWKISEGKKGTDVVFKVKGTVDVALPALMKPDRGPGGAGRVRKLVEKYIDNLIKKLRRRGRIAAAAAAAGAAGAAVAAEPAVRPSRVSD